MLKRYSAFLNQVDKIILALLAVFAAAMVIIMLYQIVLRYCFNSANVWAEELTRFIFVWLTTLGASVAIRRNIHLRVDLVVDYLKPRSRLILQIVTYTVILLFLIYLCQLGFDLMSRTMVNKSAGLRVPMAVPYSAIPFGCIFMILYCIEYIATKVKALQELGAEKTQNQGDAS